LAIVNNTSPKEEDTMKRALALIWNDRVKHGCISGAAEAAPVFVWLETADWIGGFDNESR